MANERRPLVLRWRTAVLSSTEPPSTKLTLLALAEHANPAGRDCCPGVSTLARMTSLGEKTCRRALESADGKWFTRTPMKFAGREWRGYSYHLVIPEGAVTMTGPRREVAVTVTGPQDASCGHSEPEVRSLAPEGAVTMTDDLGKAPRKSTKGAGKRTQAPLLTLREWLESCRNDDDKAIPPEDPIFEFAENAGIPTDYLYLVWRWFQHRYMDDDRKYRDWRAVFRRSVREDWHRCWRKDYSTGELVLTNVGLQLQNELQAGQG